MSDVVVWHNNPHLCFCAVDTKGKNVTKLEEHQSLLQRRQKTSIEDEPNKLWNHFLRVSGNTIQVTSLLAVLSRFVYQKAIQQPDQATEVEPRNKGCFIIVSENKNQQFLLFFPLPCTCMDCPVFFVMLRFLCAFVATKLPWLVRGKDPENRIKISLFQQ